MSRVIVEMEKKPVARALRKKVLKNRLLWLYGLTALASFTVFVVFWCTNIFRDAILSTLELRNGSSTFVWWQRPPVTLIYKVYIFNYTNVQEFQSGRASKLRVQEVGPYVYRETLNRINVEMHENNTVTYQEKRSFHWESGRPDTENVTVPNIPLMSALAFSRNINFVAQMGLTAILTALQAKPFIKVTAGGFLWGYDDNIFETAKPWVSLKQTLPFDKFGVLAFKNGVSSDRITMYTGTGDLRHLGMIQLINGVDDRKIWGDKKCDRVFGTDGSLFPPDLTRDHNKTLYVYAKDICRKMPFRYEGRAFSFGVPTFRYKIPTDSFTSTSTKDTCFCSRVLNSEPKDDFSTRVCPPAGVFNISLCNFGSPLLASFPHFYAGDSSLFRYIDGLKPQQELHETYLDLHTRLGVPISGWSRFQLNVEVRRAGSMPFSGKLQDGTILPLIWIDAGVDDIPESIQHMLYRAHYTANAVEACCQWCSLIVVLLSFGAFIAALTKDRSIEHECVPPEISVEQIKLPE